MSKYSLPLLQEFTKLTSPSPPKTILDPSRSIPYLPSKTSTTSATSSLKYSPAKSKSLKSGYPNYSYLSSSSGHLKGEAKGEALTPTLHFAPANIGNTWAPTLTRISLERPTSLSALPRVGSYIKGLSNLNTALRYCFEIRLLTGRGKKLWLRTASGSCGISGSGSLGRLATLESRGCLRRSPFKSFLRRMKGEVGGV